VPRPKKEKAKREQKSGGEKKLRAPKEKSESKAKGEKGDKCDKVKKARKKKDPNAPKGSQTAFLFFSADKRAEVRAENPELKMTEIAQQLGTRWKAMSSEDKAPYDEQARADKERYATEMVAYKLKLAAEGADLDSDGDDMLIADGDEEE